MRPTLWLLQDLFFSGGKCCISASFLILELLFFTSSSSSKTLVLYCYAKAAAAVLTRALLSCYSYGGVQNLPIIHYRALWWKTTQRQEGRKEILHRHTHHRHQPVRKIFLFINLRAKRGGSLFEAGSEREENRGVASVQKWCA